VGDILHQGNDAMGMTMNLTARIEKVTPPDETYLSYAAWLTLNKADVQTSYVDEFNFKGSAKPKKYIRWIKNTEPACSAINLLFLQTQRGSRVF
jgi:class 3 adenylate cyclase